MFILLAIDGNVCALLRHHLRRPRRQRRHHEHQAASPSVASVSYSLLLTHIRGVGRGRSRVRRRLASGAASILEVAIGRELFFDPRLSADGTISCASCHRPENGYADVRPVSVGVHGLAGQRNAPSLLDVGGRDALFLGWTHANAGRTGLDAAHELRREQGFADMEQVVERIRAVPVYVSEFARLPRSRSSNGRLRPAMRSPPRADAEIGACPAGYVECEWLAR